MLGSFHLADGYVYSYSSSTKFKTRLDVDVNISQRRFSCADSFSSISRKTQIFYVVPFMIECLMSTNLNQKLGSNTNF